jgi:hypothetical protein
MLAIGYNYLTEKKEKEESHNAALLLCPLVMTRQVVPFPLKVPLLKTLHHIWIKLHIKKL